VLQVQCNFSRINFLGDKIGIKKESHFSYSVIPEAAQHQNDLLCSLCHPQNYLISQLRQFSWDRTISSNGHWWEAKKKPGSDKGYPQCEGRMNWSKHPWKKGRQPLTSKNRNHRKPKNFQYHTRYHRVYESEDSESIEFHSLAQYKHISAALIHQLIDCNDWATYRTYDNPNQLTKTLSGIKKLLSR